MPDFKLRGNIVDPDTVISAGASIEETLDIDGMNGAISLHIISSAEVTIQMQCSNIEGSFIVPNGWTDIVHSTGEAIYEIAIPICMNAKVVLTAGGSDATVSCAVAGA